MKAAIYQGIDNMEVKEIETPRVDDEGILVRVKACAVCGSDVRIFHHGNSRVVPPQIIGHEFSGVIEGVGRNVKGFSPGERIAVGADVPCGECVFCKAGIGNNCQINYAMGYQFAGGFAEYALLNRTMVSYGPITKIPDHVSYEEAALAEPLGCVINALTLSGVNIGDTFALIGAGPIGLMLMQAAKMMGACKVIAIELVKERLEIAKRFGADVCICPADEDAAARVLEETGGLGADIVYTANSVPQTQADALKMAKNRGRVCFFGGLAKDRSNVTLDTNIIHYKELFVHGAHGSMPVHHMKAVNLIASGKIDMKKFISHKMPLDQIREAFRIAESYEGLRVVVNP
jgi:L-iditol 2-dehydrogenase